MTPEEVLVVASEWAKQFELTGREDTAKTLRRLVALVRYQAADMAVLSSHPHNGGRDERLAARDAAVEALRALGVEP